MNLDQAAPMEQSDLGLYCLQYRLPNNVSRGRVVTNVTRLVTEA